MPFKVSSQRFVLLDKSTRSTALAVFLSLQFSLSANSQTAPSSTVSSSELDTLSTSQNTTTVIDFGKNKTLNISGLLQNSGTIYLVSSDPNTTRGVINAAKIINNSGAVISSVIPQGGLPGFDFLVPNFSFSLNASGSLINRGVIASAGSLSISAAQIVNSPALNAAANSASITALSNLNINSTIGAITNGGNLASLNGNVNITAPMGKDLIINNGSGIIQALLGSVNLGDSLSTITQNVALLGGDVVSKELNLHAACGTAIVNADAINAVLNVVANETHIMTSSPLLHLGEINLSGDPTFFNTSGDIFIDSNLVFNNAPLAIVAAGNILTADGAGRIETNGGDITMIAGVSFFSSLGSSVVDPFAPFTLTINGTSLSGGKIDLEGTAPISSLNSGGGKIIMMANNAATPGSGFITIPSSVTTKSKGGDIVILGLSVSTGIIDSSGTTKNGDISLYRNDNSGCAGCTITNSKFSGQLPLAFTPNPPNEPIPQMTGRINLAGVTSGGGNILLFARDFLTGPISANSSSSTGGNIDIVAEIFTFELGAGAVHGVNGSITSKGQSQGGNLSIRTYSPISLLSTAAIDVSAVSGNAGKIDLSAGDKFAPNLITINSNKLSANGTGAKGNGGEIVLLASQFQLNQHSIIEANGSGTGSGGKITMWAGGSDPSTLPNIGLASGELELRANSGLSGGNGGIVYLEGGVSTVVVDPAALQLNPLGADGNGGGFTFRGDSFISSDLVLNGSGHGNGGSVVLDSTFYLFTDISVGPSVTDHGVKGVIKADSGPLGGGGGSITLRAPNLLLAAANSISVNAVSGDGGSISLSSESSPLLLPSGTISVDGTGPNSNGGKIYLYGDSIDAPPGQPIFLSASGKGDGNGGQIDVHSYSNPLATGTGAGTIQAMAFSGSSGGNGGSVLLDAPNLTVNSSDIDVAPKGASGDGGSISLFANKFSGNSIDLTGTLHANGVGSGKGGTIGVYTQGNLFIDGSVLANGAGTGDGGSIHLTGVQNIGAGTTSKGVNGVIQSNSGNLGGAGGYVFISSNSNDIAINALEDISASAKDGHGGTIYLLGFAIDVSSGAGIIDVSGAGAHGDGGEIHLQGNVNYAGNLTLAANGSGDGNGGLIAYTGSSTTIGTGPSQVSLYANGGSPGSLKGNAGTFYIYGAISDVAALQAKPLGINGDGAEIYLGTLGFTGDIDASGKGTGNGGVIQVSSMYVDSVGPGAGPDGINGVLSVNSESGKAGKILLTSNVDMTILPGALSVKSTNGAGGEIFINVQSLDLAGSNLSVDAGNGDGGLIQIYANSYVNNPNPSLISANGAGAGNGGTIQIHSPGDLDFANTNTSLQANSGALSGNGGTIHLEADQALNVDMAKVEAAPKGSTGNGGTFEFLAITNLNITGSINADGVGNGDGGSVKLASSSTTPFTVGGAVTESGITGSISANGAGTGKGGNITLQTLQGSFPASSLALVVNSSISAMPDSSGYGRLNLVTTPNYKNIDISLTGNGTVNAAISNNDPSFAFNGSYNSVLIDLPSQSVIDIGQIRTTNETGNSDITINAQSLNLFSGSILSSTFGSVLVNTSTVTNDGVIAAPNLNNLSTPTPTLTFQSNSDLSITGKGALIGNIQKGNVIFNSAGNIYVRQASLTGTYSANAPGTIDVSFSPRVTTSSLLAAAGKSAEGSTEVSKRTEVVSLTLPSFQFNSSSVVSTDSVPRHISFDGGEEDSGIVDVGEHKFVVTNNLQSLSAFVASDDSLEFAQEGTEVSKEEDKVYLHRGKMVVSAGKKGESLTTPEGELKVDPNSTVVVQVSVSGTVSAVSLNGSSSLTKTGAESSISIQKGEELVSNQGGLDEEELIPVDGVERGEVITAGLTKQGGRASVKRSVSVKQMISKDIMINGSLIHVRGATKKQHNTYVENLKSSADSQSPIKPIAFIQPVGKAMPPVPASSAIARKPVHSAVTLSSDGTKLKQTEPGFVKLDSGDLFLHAKEDTVINAKFCNIIAKKGSCVNVSSAGEKTTIRVCSGVKAVKVLIGKNASLLSAGEELVISKRNLKNSDVYNIDTVGHRNCRTMHCLGYYFAHSDFSIPALLTSKDYLRDLLHAKEDTMKSLRSRVLKAAVIVQMVQGKYGRYSVK